MFDFLQGDSCERANRTNDKLRSSSAWLQTRFGRGPRRVAFQFCAEDAPNGAPRRRLRSLS